MIETVDNRLRMAESWISNTLGFIVWNYRFCFCPNRAAAVSAFRMVDRPSWFTVRFGVRLFFLQIRHAPERRYTGCYA